MTPRMDPAAMPAVLPVLGASVLAGGGGGVLVGEGCEVEVEVSVGGVVGDGVGLGDGKPVVVAILVEEGSPNDGVKLGRVVGLGVGDGVVLAGVGEGAALESLCVGFVPELVPGAKLLDDFGGGSAIKADVDCSTSGGGNTMAWRTIKCGDEILVVDKDWLDA
jgi:hypothetical protein